MNGNYDRSIFLHVGMAKSGTSSLQRNAFKHCTGITYLGRPSITEEVDWAIRQICRADSIFYDEDPIRAILERSMGHKSKTDPVVISYENFCLYESKDKGIVAERLKSLFPKAKIIFTLRRQEDLLASWYLQRAGRYARHKHYLDFETWLNLKLKAPNRSILDDLSYFEAINYYSQLFGRENVRVFFFEDLRVDPVSYCKTFADMLGVDADEFVKLFLAARENPTITAATIPFSRFVAPFLPKQIVKPLAYWLVKRGGRPATVEIGDRGREVVREICAQSNRRLQETLNLNLEDRGYTMARTETNHALAQTNCGQSPREVKISDGDSIASTGTQRV